MLHGICLVHVQTARVQQAIAQIGPSFMVSGSGTTSGAARATNIVSNGQKYFHTSFKKSPCRMPFLAMIWHALTPRQRVL